MARSPLRAGESPSQLIGRADDQVPRLQAFQARCPDVAIMLGLTVHSATYPGDDGASESRTFDHLWQMLDYLEARYPAGSKVVPIQRSEPSS